MTELSEPHLQVVGVLNFKRDRRFRSEEILELKKVPVADLCRTVDHIGADFSLATLEVVEQCSQSGSDLREL